MFPSLIKYRFDKFVNDKINKKENSLIIYIESNRSNFIS